MTKRTRRPLRTGGHAWGQSRVDLHISIRELAERAGINRGDLSKMERGRMVPTGEEFAKVMAVLDEARARAGSGTAVMEDPGSPPPGSSYPT